MSETRWLVALDPGMLSHFSGIVVVEAEPRDFGPHARFVHQVRHLERHRRTSYADLGDRLGELFEHPTLLDALFVMDSSGIGGPLLETLQARGLRPLGITFTGGADAHRDQATGLWRVPKTQLMATLQLVVDQGRLAIAERLKLAHVLAEELAGLQLHVSDAGNLTFSHGSGEGHADLAMALAMGVWWLERQVPIAGWEYHSVESRRGLWNHEPVWGRMRGPSPYIRCPEDAAAAQRIGTEAWRRRCLQARGSEKDRK